MHEDHDIDIIFYNDLISNNEYRNGMSINIVMIFALILWFVIMLFIYVLI